MKSLRQRSLFILFAVASLVMAASAQSAWVNTATQGISLSRLASASDLGPAPGDQAITVRLALTLQNKPALLQYVASINDPSNALYGETLTPAQFASTYAPSAAQVDQAVSYLQGAGFGNIAVEPNNLLISANGTVAQANSAFNTTIEQFAQFGNTVYGNISAAQVPASLSGIVGSVLGLNSIGQMKPTLVTHAQVAVPAYDVSYNPQGFWQIYGATGVPAAAQASIAIMAEGDVTGTISDLRIAEKAFGLPEVPVSVVQVGLASTDTSGADEWDLDTQYSSGMAGNLKHLYIYATTSLSDSDLALEFSRWATDDKAKAGSASLGECEIFPYLDGSMLADDNTFLEAAAQGQTFFASTGDTGSFCPAEVGENGVPAGAPLVNYPAASQYAVAAGGTTLLANSDGNYDQEIAWYAGGGGISQFEGAPYWQVSANIVSATELNSRGIPDIAMDADPYSGANVYVNGVVEVVGGTSLSSPLSLGVWARMISAKPKLGFAPLRLYALYDGTGTVGSYPEGGFHDIILGKDGLYTAAPGWDYTTGLGSLWVSQLYADLN
ncbi:MAG: S53 family peptidase [Terracidiphilus sp.]|jgi:subtilase family serine protease